MSTGTLLNASGNNVTKGMHPLTENLEVGKIYIYSTNNPNVFHIGYYNGENTDQIFVKKWALLVILQDQRTGQAKVNFTQPPSESLGKQVSQTCLAKWEVLNVIEPKPDLGNAFAAYCSGLISANAGQMPPAPAGMR